LLLEALSGESPGTDAAELRVCGQDAGRLHPIQRRALGLATTADERLGRAVVPGMALRLNALLTARKPELTGGALIPFAALAQFTAELLKHFDVRGASIDTAADRLSGGNLQKFVVGREILQEPRVLISAQPTAGVDVGASAFIRQALINARNGGAAVLVISEEIDELFEICDRIAVIAAGHLTPARPLAQTSIEEIGIAMMRPAHESESTAHA
jgi:simple sugar transport system ATP-binding protein